MLEVPGVPLEAGTATERGWDTILQDFLGSHLWRIDSCITQLEPEGTSRTCNKTEEEERTF